MCGIVGYIGTQDAKEILLKGLEKLEYRGYDSAGISLLNEKGNHIFKVKGRIDSLRRTLDKTVKSTMGIGHTRWATHGVPSVENAHPHQSISGRFSLVHNGVVENHRQLRETYLQDIPMKSETDTEVVVQLIEKLYKEQNNVIEAFQQTINLLKGSYAIALIDERDPEKIYVAKNKSPLLVGLGDNDFNVVASDAMAMLQVTDQFVEIMDEEIVIVERKNITIQKLDGSIVERDSFIAELDASDIEKGTYPHFMLKEIDEQALVIRKIIEAYQDEQNQIIIEDTTRNALQQADRIYIIAAGTSYHAGLVGKQFIENLARIPVEVHIASEFAYNMPLLSENPLFIFISQSGETADSRSVLVQIKEMGYPTLTIVNVPGSTLSRMSDHTLYLYAGPEIAVASTKAYTAQLAVLAILAADMANTKGIQLDFDLLQELSIVSSAIETLCDQKEKIESITEHFLTSARNCFFLGRGMDYYVGLEGALKLKEFSYIQAEGYAGGELKHGTIALIEENTPVIALATQSALNDSIRSNVEEVIARGANVCLISMEDLEGDSDSLTIPKVLEILSPLVSVIPLQLIAYYATLHRDCDVDKPRNLAKSVTVE